MNPVVKAQLDSFKKSYPNDELQDPEFFELMSIFSIENGYFRENIDPFKVHLTGNEFGIDGLSISVQGVLCADIEEARSILENTKKTEVEFRFYQSKIAEKYDYGEISKFLDAVLNFFKETESESDQLKDLQEIKDLVYSKLTKKNPSLKCFYITTGGNEISEKLQRLKENKEAQLNGLNIFSEVEINFIGAKTLQEAYRAATNSTSAALDFPHSVTIPPHEKSQEAYIGFICASEILNLATHKPANNNPQIDRSIFFDNVRDFDPDSEINKSIIQQLRDGDYSSFIFKNNGITIVAKDIQRIGNKYQLEDYQIVNGCQTTNILFSVKEAADKILLPLKLIESKDPDFVSTIIVGTNKQNKVGEEQFWALLPFMKNLEEYSSNQPLEDRIHIERRENQYRENTTIDKTRILRPTDLMKAAAAMYLFQPHRAARDHRAIREEFSDQIFSETHNVELYHIAALALHKFETLLKKRKIPRNRSIFKFYCLYALTRQHWNTPDILNAPPKSQKSVVKKLKTIIDDTEIFLESIEKFSELIERLTKEQGISSREKIRDYIRSDTFIMSFSQKIKPKTVATSKHPQIA